jgi:hypothetical protein
MVNAITQITVSQTELSFRDPQPTDTEERNYRLLFIASIITNQSQGTVGFYGRLCDGEKKYPAGQPLDFTFQCNNGDKALPYEADVQLNKNGDQFTIELSEDENFSSKIYYSTALAATYNDVHAVYSGGALALNWENPSASISYGQVKVSGDMDVNVNTPQRARGYFLPLPREFFGDSSVFKVSCTPCAQNNASSPLFFGPPTPPIEVITAVPNIISVDLSGGSNCVIMFSLSTEWGDAAGWKAKLVLALNGEKPNPASALSANAAKTTDGNYSAVFDVTGVAVPALYTAYLFISSADGKYSNQDFPQGTYIPLSPPDVDIIRHGGGTALTLKFSMPWNHTVTQYIISVSNSAGVTVNGDVPLVVNGDKYEIEDACAYFGKVLTVMPVFGDKHGAAATVRLFQKGYYYADGMLAYVDSEVSYVSKTADYALPPGCFSKALDSPIKSEDGLLSVAASGLSLTIKTDGALARAAYENWIMALFAAGLTAGGYYVLRNIVARNAVIGSADAEYIQLGINIETGVADGTVTFLRTADIFPGAILRVFTSAFTLQPDKNAGDDMQGYSSASAVDFPAALRVKENVEYIEFDKNLDELIGPWGSIFAANSDKKIVYGGAVDFYNTNVKKSFVRIFAPLNGFVPSGTAEREIQAMDNMYLCFSDRFEDLETERKQPAYPPRVNYMVFRGRAALSACVTVRFNEVKNVIPAGTTLREYVAQYGVADLKNLKLLRRNGSGELVSVFADPAKIGDMPLLAGDEIC